LLVMRGGCRAGRVGRGFLCLANDEVTGMWINLCL